MNMKISMLWDVTPWLPQFQDKKGKRGPRYRQGGPGDGAVSMSVGDDCP
jgi:hypothetical protein